MIWACLNPPGAAVQQLQLLNHILETLSSVSSPVLTQESALAFLKLHEEVSMLCVPLC